MFSQAESIHIPKTFITFAAYPYTDTGCCLYFLIITFNHLNHHEKNLMFGGLLMYADRNDRL